ncbi:MAG: transporter substrate-binding domain-containing protein [Alphaproteobacteria bacterium]|nr:transporter substrate-binding domain-containing protein [Alphaproteobacteria bacterium]
MKIISLLAMLTVLLTARLGHAASLDDITFYTEEYPPYNFTENGRVTGITTEVLDYAFRKHNTRKGVRDIIMADWNTGYQAVLKGPNKAIYTMNRSAEREDLFKWAGPITPNTVDVFARKDRNFTITYDGELKRHRVAVVKDDIGHIKAKGLGVPEQNIIVRTTTAENLADLEAGRADIWIYGGTTGKYLMRQAGILDKYESVLTVFRGGHYVGFSLDVDDNIVEKLQEAIDEVKLDGTLERIMQKYGK